MMTTLMMISCTDEEKQGVCFSFDIRSCETDMFADDVDMALSQEDREQKLEEWLEDQGLEVNDIRLELNFHEAVCEACYICPQGDRYFVSIEGNEEMSIEEDFDLLNFEWQDCAEVFN